MKMLGDRLLLLPVDEAETSVGGIIIPDNAKERSCKGVVVFVGPDVKYAFMPGDQVIHSPYAGTEYQHENEPHLICRESDLLAVLR